MGFLADADLAAALLPFAAALPPERLPLLDFVLWRLTGGSERSIGAMAAPVDAHAALSRLLPRIRDDAIHRAVALLRAAIEGGA
jgi:hypothetical protein